MDIRLARDERGTPTAYSPPPAEAVGAFFEREVGPDPELGDQILEIVDDVASGRETGAPQLYASAARESYVTIDPSFGGVVEVCVDLGESGGAYQDARKDRHGVFLVCDVPLPDFQAALVGWLAFVRGGGQDAEPGAAADTGPKAGRCG